MSVFSTRPNSVVLAITRKNIKHFIFLEIHVTYDIISSDLVLTVRHYMRFSANIWMCEHLKLVMLTA